MKRALFVLIVLLQMSLLTHAQYYTDPNMSSAQKEALRKVKQYTGVKKTGYKLLAGGGAAAVLSIALMSSAEFYTDPHTGQRVTEDSNFVLGLVGFVYVGIPLIATGTTLSIIGNAKEKSYMRKLDNLSASYFNKQGANGIRLVYNF